MHGSNWIRGALLGLSAGGGLAGAAWGNPGEARELTLTLVRGRGAAEQRLLFLPFRAVGGATLHLRFLDALAPGLGRRLLRRFLSLEESPELALPEGLQGAGFLFGLGGGAFRLEGSQATEEVRELLRVRGLDLEERGPDQTLFTSPEVWGWQQEGLLYGAWGGRPERLWLHGLDGLGRRVHEVRGPDRIEVLEAWRGGNGGGETDLGEFFSLPLDDVPFDLRRVELRVRRPTRRGAGYRVRVGLVPRDPGDREELVAWVQMFWEHPEDAQVRIEGPAVSVAWREDGASLGPRLETWGRRFEGWMVGDRYRTLL